MTLKELKQKRTDLFHQISGLRDTFTKAGDKWPTDADKQKWDAAERGIRQGRRSD